MKMKNFFHLTFIFLLLACLAHSAGAITDLDSKWHIPQVEVDNNFIASVYHN